MSLNFTDFDAITVRLANSEEEIELAQQLRFNVFYEEHTAKPSDEVQKLRRDFDEYDTHADHLVVVDHSGAEDRIVGTYRLLQRDGAEKAGQFYTAGEYTIDPLLKCGSTLLELGRSCVLPDYRSRPVMQLLWQGIADYVAENDIEIMFGCASFYNTDIEALAPSLSYLHHYHLAPEKFRVRAVDSRYIDMNIIPQSELNARRVFAELPPLIKGYLRLGGAIGEGAVIDEQFDTTDVCIIVQTHMVTDRYRKHYERKNQKAMPRAEEAESNNVHTIATGKSS